MSCFSGNKTATITWLSRSGAVLVLLREIQRTCSVSMLGPGHRTKRVGPSQHNSTPIMILVIIMCISPPTPPPPQAVQGPLLLSSTVTPCQTPLFKTKEKVFQLWTAHAYWTVKKLAVYFALFFGHVLSRLGKKVNPQLLPLKKVHDAPVCVPFDLISSSELLHWWQWLIAECCK